MSNGPTNAIQNESNERGNNMTKQAMQGVLKRISGSAEHSSLVGVGAGGDLLFIQTYNKLRKKAIANNWIDEDIVAELDINDKSIFRDNAAIMDIIGAAAEIFRGALQEDG